MLICDGRVTGVVEIGLGLKDKSYVMESLWRRLVQ